MDGPRSRWCPNTVRPGDSATFLNIPPPHMHTHMPLVSNHCLQEAKVTSLISSRTTEQWVKVQGAESPSSEGEAQPLCYHRLQEGTLETQGVSLSLVQGRAWERQGTETACSANSFCCSGATAAGPVRAELKAVSHR